MVGVKDDPSERLGIYRDAKVTAPAQNSRKVGFPCTEEHSALADNVACHHFIITVASLVTVSFWGILIRE